MHVGVLAQDDLELPHQRRVVAALLRVEAHRLGRGVLDHIHRRFPHVPLLAREAVPEGHRFLVRVQLDLGLLEGRHDVGRLGKLVRIHVLVPFLAATDAVTDAVTDTGTAIGDVDVHHLDVVRVRPRRPRRRRGRRPRLHLLLRPLRVHLLAIRAIRATRTLGKPVEHLFLHRIRQLLQQHPPHGGLGPLGRRHQRHDDVLDVRPHRRIPMRVQLGLRDATQHRLDLRFHASLIVLSGPVKPTDNLEHRLQRRGHRLGHLVQKPPLDQPLDHRHPLVDLHQRPADPHAPDEGRPLGCLETLCGQLLHTRLCRALKDARWIAALREHDN